MQTLSQLRAKVSSDLTAVDNLIQTELQSNVELVNQLGAHIIGSGGKRLRPLLVLLAASACGYQGKEHITLAAIIEFIHTATLLHDDVVDNSLLRRGQDTANNIWGNSASVLVGDFLYSRSFQLMMRVEKAAVMQTLADTTNAIAEGEVLQLINKQEEIAYRANYFEVIERKTARLFAASAKLGAIVADKEPAMISALYNFGLNVGFAYQLIDDVLDYTGNEELLGKNLGDDLKDGKITLPLIYCIEQDKNSLNLIKQGIAKPNRENVEQISKFILENGAIEHCRNLAKSYVDKACQEITNYKNELHLQTLLEFAKFNIERDH